MTPGTREGGAVDNHTDYECYLLGCRSAGIEPLEEWRFRMLQAEYLRRAAEPEQPSASPISGFVLEQLATAMSRARPLPGSASRVSLVNPCFQGLPHARCRRQRVRTRHFGAPDPLGAPDPPSAVLPIPQICIAASGRLRHAA